MANNLCPWVAISFALLTIPAAQAQTTNSVQYYTDHPAERRATELRCYQQGATGTKSDLDCDNAERASWAALANSAARRTQLPGEDPASPVYWQHVGPRITRSTLDSCIHPPNPNPLPTPAEDCEAAALALLGKPR